MVIARTRRPVAPVVKKTIPIIPAAPAKNSVDRLAEIAETSRARKEAQIALETIKRYADKVRNPRTAIRAKCVECSGGSLKEVNECRVITCALHPFRMGVNPFNKKTRMRLERESGEGGVEDSEDEDDGDEE